MEPKNTEYRRFEDVELRVVDAADGKGMPILEGRAASYNKLSKPMGPAGKKFRERILPGFFDAALRSDSDVKGLFNHNPDYVLGRTTSGTMELRGSPEGLNYKMMPPDTQAGRDAVTSVRRKDVDGVSFGMRNIVDRWKMENGERIRELVSAEVFDISLTAFPAYEGTSVALRSLVQAEVRGQIGKEGGETATETAGETRQMVGGGEYDSGQIRSAAREALQFLRLAFDSLQEVTCQVGNCDLGDLTDGDRSYLGNMFDQCDDTQDKMDEAREACDGMMEPGDSGDGDDDEEDVEDEDARSEFSAREMRRKQLMLAAHDLPEVMAGLNETRAEAAGDGGAGGAAAKKPGTVQVNKAGVAAAHAAAAAGDVDAGPWSFSAEDGKALLGKDGKDWAAYGKMHLGIDPSAEKDTEGYYKYPWGKMVDGKAKLFAKAINAAKSRAGNPKNKARSIAKVAAGLGESIK